MMNKQAYQNAVRDVIYLAGCAVNGIVPDAARVQAMDLEALYRVANRHLLTAITAMALESAGVRDQAFTQAKGKAIRKLAVMDADMAALFKRFDSAGIWYVPLKGAVLKGLYPAYGMRQMSDCDILFDAKRADDVKAIMMAMGFSCKSFGVFNHDVYHMKPVSNFEMHRALFIAGTFKEMAAFYRDVETRLIPGPGCSRRFSDEDLYVYITAHEYKHYSDSGTGLRSILDTYVFLKRYSDTLNWETVAADLEKLGIADFERRNRSLATHLFGGGTLTPEDQAMLQYVVNSGTYGTLQNSVEKRIDKLGGGRRGKLKFALGRVFKPLEDVKAVYPFYYRHKALLPVLFVWRVMKGLTVKRKKVWAEFKVLTKKG